MHENASPQENLLRTLRTMRTLITHLSEDRERVPLQTAFTNLLKHLQLAGISLRDL